MLSSIPQDITVNKDCVKLLTELKEVRPEFLVAYQSSVGQFEKPPEKEPDPVKMLREFISVNNLRVWDLFKSYDKDKSLTVTREEFKKGLVVRPSFFDLNWLSEVVKDLYIFCDFNK